MGDCLLERPSVVLFVKFILLILFFLLSSCISVDLDSFKDQAAKNVRFTPPPSPYKSVSKKGMDASWHNTENNSSISFFSNCFPHESWTPLSQFQQEILSELKSFRIIKTKKTTHKNEKAHHLWLKNSHRQNSTSQQYMQLLLFKKSNCFYVLASLTRGPKQKKNEQTFQDFIQGFEIL